MSHRSLIVCLCCLAVTFGVAACASTQSSGPGGPPAPSDDVQIRQFKKTVGRVMAQFRPHLSPEERRIVDEIEVQVADAVTPVLASAEKEGDRRWIILSLGLVKSIELVQDAATLITFSETGSSDDFIRYARTLAEQYRRTIRSNGNGLAFADLPRYVDYKGLTESDVWALYRSPYYQQYRANAKIETVALVLAHEIGHHVLHHLSPENRAPRDAPKRVTAARTHQREVEADDFAISLATRSGYSLMFGGWYLYFFAVLGEEPDPDLRKHPLAVCRFLRVQRQGIKNMLAVDTFVPNDALVSFYREHWNPEKLRMLDNDLATIQRDHC